jgi:hypothetical protein
MRDAGRAERFDPLHNGRLYYVLELLVTARALRVPKISGDLNSRFRKKHTTVDCAATNYRPVTQTLGAAPSQSAPNSTEHIIDEAQTVVGRTELMLAYQIDNVVPIAVKRSTMSSGCSSASVAVVATATTDELSQGRSSLLFSSLRGFDACRG